MHGGTEEIHVLSIMGINNTVACGQTSNAAEVLRGETAMGRSPARPTHSSQAPSRLHTKRTTTVEEKHNQLNAQFPHRSSHNLQAEPRSPLRVHNLFLCSSSCVSDVVVDIHSWQFHQFLRSTRVVWPTLWSHPHRAPSSCFWCHHVETNSTSFHAQRPSSHQRNPAQPHLFRSTAASPFLAAFSPP